MTLVNRIDSTPFSAAIFQRIYTAVTKNLSVNYVDLSGYFAKRDDGCGKVVECKKTTVKLLVACKVN